jgi:hypothetical protein
MTDPFAIFKDKCSAAIAAMILGVLLLLPASLGLGGTIIEEAFGQFNLPSIPGEEETTPIPPQEEVEPTLPPSASTFILRGFIGSSLPAQGGAIPTENSSSHIVNGRWRIFAEESLVHRFVAEMDLAAIDGTAFHNITIEETEPHRFEVTESGNGTATTTATGSIPPVSSNIRTRIYVDSNVPIINDVPMTISIRGQVLAIEGIDIDEARVADAGIRNILSIIDGQSIYGTVPR